MCHSGERQSLYRGAKSVNKPELPQEHFERHDRHLCRSFFTALLLYTQRSRHGFRSLIGEIWFSKYEIKSLFTMF